MMTTLCPLGIDLKFSTAFCHSPPLLVARCGSRQAARHAVWQDEKISHSLKSSAAATLQSLRNVPSLRTSLFLAFPFAPFPSRSPHRCLCPCPCPWPELVSQFQFQFSALSLGSAYSSGLLVLLLLLHTLPLFIPFSLLQLFLLLGVSHFGSWLNKLNADYM